MKRVLFASVLLLALAPVLVGCGDDEETTEPEVTYDLTFTGDATFQMAHGDQDIHVAVVEQGSGEVVAEDDGVVSADDDPVFSFSFPDVLVAGNSYFLDYWIDSNFDGGDVGTCDPPVDDHQWRIEITDVNSAEVINDVHRPGETESVCSTFQ